MNQHPTSPGEDDAVARLRAADPAATSVPDAGALREAVRLRAAGSSGGADGETSDEVAAARSRRWGSWPARAAAAAAVALVAGGGGYAIGTADGGDAAQVIALAEPGRAEELPEGPMDALSGPATMAAPESAAMGRAADMSLPGWGARTVFSASGLSSQESSAQAWALDPGQVFGAQTLADVAAALGIEGEPELVDGVWMVGARDGSGPGGQLYPDGTGSVSFYDPTKDPWACGVVLEGGETAPEPCVERDLPASPSVDAATDQLRDLLAALGVDPADYEISAETYDGEVMTYVSAYQVLDGQRTGLTWSASITGAGVQSLHGSLAPLVALGEYEVISPAAAVERLGDPRFGAGWGGPIAYLPSVAMREEMSVEPTVPTLPESVQPGASVSWPVEQVTITEARLGLALHTEPDGAALLVPTYELTSADGGIWSVVAVAESHLDLSSAR